MQILAKGKDLFFAAGIITGEQKTLKSDKRIDVLAAAPGGDSK